MYARGRNTVTANVLLNVILGHGIGHGDDGPFAHGIGKAVRERRGAGDGSHIENHTSTVRLHVPDALMDTVVDAFYIDAKEAVEIFFRGGLDGSNMRDPGVVHQDVDALLGEHLLKCFADLPLVRDIAAMDSRVATSGSDQFRGCFRLLRVDIRDSNGSAVSSKTQSDGLSNAAACAGNDGYFAIQPEIAGAAQRETPRFQGIKSS